MEAIRLESVIPQFPPGGGLILSAKGTKDAAFVFKSSRIKIEGDQFWKSLSNVLGSKMVATFKLAVHPVLLSDEMFDHSSLQPNDTNANFDIKLGTSGKLKAGKHVLLKRMRKMIAEGDPSVSLEFEYGNKKLGWKQEGILFYLRFKLSDLIRCSESNSNLIVDSNPTDSPVVETPPEDNRISTSSFEVLSKVDIEDNLEEIITYFPNFDIQDFKSAKGLSLREKALCDKIVVQISEDTDFSQVIPGTLRNKRLSARASAKLKTAPLFLNMEDDDGDEKKKLRSSSNALRKDSVKKDEKKPIPVTRSNTKRTDSLSKDVLLWEKALMEEQLMIAKHKSSEIQDETKTRRSSSSVKKNKTAPLALAVSMKDSQLEEIIQDEEEKNLLVRVQEQKEKIRQDEENEMRIKMERKRYFDNAATTIQRVYRGYVIRQKIENGEIDLTPLPKEPIQEEVESEEEEIIVEPEEEVTLSEPIVTPKVENLTPSKEKEPTKLTDKKKIQRQMKNILKKTKDATKEIKANLDKMDVKKMVSKKSDK
eukprot:TRINITY_DN8404_c0_g1_i1.p1 TRINITY_DN8404_c0_g1~~TRINITY_DN8404_c0_g1_i1.p1  ORF type:complete len:536 (-),score=171.64 TRINITY_DN8404_c0_g1_i1:7-1614(-)